MVEDDAVLDYMIMEAVALKVAREDEDAKKAQERKEFRDTKSNKEGFQYLRDLTA